MNSAVTGGEATVSVVFLVDDQLIVGEAVRRMLAPHADIRFHYCGNPAEAVRQAEAVRPTVILQDLVLAAGVDGLGLVRQYRAHATLRDIPIIVLSTKEDAAIKSQAFETGANDYIVKLPDPLEFLARVRYHSRVRVLQLQRDAATRALEVRNAFIKQVFSRYMTDDVVENLLENPQGLAFGGENRVVSVLMSDLRGFTAIAERLRPEQVVELLNIHLGAMAEVITRHRGTIDEFIGDAILAIFGAPIAREDHAESAVACALAMQLAMADVNRQVAHLGVPPLEMGIGINTGEVVVGNIGSAKRAKYGVVGSHVNLAGRIESATVGGQVLVSQSTVDALRDIIELRRAITLHPKGAKEPITIHEVTGLGGAHQLRLRSGAEPEDWEPLDPALACECSLIGDGKQMLGAPMAARLTRLCTTSAQIETTQDIELTADVRLRFRAPTETVGALDLYGKVVGLEPDSRACVVRFTSLPPELCGDTGARAKQLGELLRAHARG